MKEIIIMEVVKIINPKQAMLYMKHGLKCNCYYDNDKIIYEFEKSVKCRYLFKLWCDRKLK